MHAFTAWLPQQDIPASSCSHLVALLVALHCSSHIQLLGRLRNKTSARLYLMTALVGDFRTKTSRLPHQERLYLVASAPRPAPSLPSSAFKSACDIKPALDHTVSASLLWRLMTSLTRPLISSLLHVLGAKV